MPATGINRASARIAAAYALFAMAWIISSDVLVDRLMADHLSELQVNIAKGLAFVAVTALALYGVIRRRIEKEVRLHHTAAAAEHALHAVLDQAQIAIYLLQGGRIAFANDFFARALGFTRGADLKGANPMEYVEPADQARVAAHLTGRVSGEKVEPRYEFAARRRDGTRFDVGVHAMLIQYNGKPAILGFAQDITDRQTQERQIHEYIARLERSVRGTLQVASRMVELRDPYTRGHERRVGELAAAIGSELGLPPDRVEGLRVAGSVHDIGKIAVPAEILSKPSRLSPAEYELVQQHARQGFAILDGIEFPWPVAQVTLQHHERMDGRGYPQGLKGDAILLEARILGVADTVEAMASHRPYRPGLGLDKALAEVEKQRGVSFDAAVVDACLRLFREKGYALPT